MHVAKITLNVTMLVEKMDNVNLNVVENYSLVKTVRITFWSIFYTLLQPVPVRVDLAIMVVMDVITQYALVK